MVLHIKVQPDNTSKAEEGEDNEYGYKITHLSYLPP